MLQCEKHAVKYKNLVLTNKTLSGTVCAQLNKFYIVLTIDLVHVKLTCMVITKLNPR